MYVEAVVKESHVFRGVRKMKCLQKFFEKCLWLVLVLVFGVAGCAHTVEHSRLQIIPLTNQYTLALSADDIVEVMRRAGFSDEQILELGPDMYEGLLHSGAAQLKVDDEVEAIFAVHGDCVYITTRMRGSFVYNVKTGWATPPPKS